LGWRPAASTRGWQCGICVVLRARPLVVEHRRVGHAQARETPPEGGRSFDPCSRVFATPAAPFSAGASLSSPPRTVRGVGPSPWRGGGVAGAARYTLVGRHSGRAPWFRVAPSSSARGGAKARPRGDPTSWPSLSSQLDAPASGPHVRCFFGQVDPDSHSITPCRACGPRSVDELTSTTT